MCVSDLKLAILTIFEPLHGLVKCSTSHTTITTLFSGPPSSPGRSSGGTTQPVPALAPGASSLNLPGQLPLGGGVTHYSSCIRLLREVGSHGTHPLAPASFSQCRFLLSVPLPSLSVALSSSPVSQPVLDSPSLLKTEQHSASGWITPGSPTTRRRGLGCCHLLVAVS